MSEDYIQRNTSMMKGDWTEGIKSIADTIDGILTMKNNLAEKKQKREMQDIQMQQMRMQLQGQQRQMQQQDELKSALEGVSKTKTINLSEADIASAYEPAAWEAMPSEEKNKLLQQEVPKSDTEMLKDVVRVQMEHGLKTGQIPLDQAAAWLKQLEANPNSQLKVHETEITGNTIPPERRNDIPGGVSRSSDKTYRVLRDDTGKIVKVIGEGKPTYAGIAGSTRGMQVFDAKVGKVVPVSWDEKNADPGRYISTQDPNVRALQEHEKYSTGMSRFTNRLDTLGETIKKTVTSRGLNQGNKFQNFTVQDLINNRMLGNGDVVGLNNLVHGFAAELGKVESGSIGISGATVEALKRFDISPNLPVADLFKALDIAKDAGQSVTDAMDETRKSVYSKIYSGIDYEPPKHIKVSKVKEDVSTPKKKTSPYPFKVLMGRAQASNPGMNPAEVEKNLREKYEFTE